MIVAGYPSVPERDVATRAQSLLSLLPSKATRFFCLSECVDLSALTHAVADAAGGTLCDTADAAHVIIADRIPAPDATPEDSVILIFGSGLSLLAERPGVQTHRAPTWLIEEAAAVGRDLVAVRAGDTSQFVNLSRLHVLDARNRRQPAGLYGELAVESTSRGQFSRTGAWGKILPGGRLVLSNFNTSAFRVGARTVDTQALAARLRAVKGIRELVAVGRRTLAGEPQIAIYWSAITGAARPDVEAELLSAADVPGCAHALELPQLLYDRHGSPEWQRLATLPFLDSVECSEVRDRLLLVGVKEVLPKRVLALPQPPALPPFERPVLRVAPGNDSAVRGELALLDGGPLRLPKDHPSSLASLLDRAARLYPAHEIRCIDGTRETVLTYASLTESARGIAASLRARGLRPRDRIVLQISSIESMLRWFWASQYVGLSACVLGRTGDDARDLALLQSVAQRTAARLCISECAAALQQENVLDTSMAPGPTLRHEAVEPSPDDVALILCTSGSSAEPKLVPQTHAALIAQGYASGTLQGLTPSDISCNWMPLDHVGGLVMFHLRDVQVCCGQIQVSRDRVLADPLLWLDLMERYRVSVSWSPQFGYALLADAMERRGHSARNLQCLKLLINGGEAVVAETAEQCASLLSHWGVLAGTMRPAWGMSETCSLATLSRQGSLAADARNGAVSVGMPIAGTRIRVVDSSRRVVFQGEVGELEISGPSVFGGYLEGSAIPRRSPEDPWFATGDLATIDDAGLRIVGRAKDVIIVNGQNFSCLSIERELQSLDEVETAHTCAVAHREPGANTDRAAVFVVPREGADPLQIAQRAHAMLSRSLGLDALMIPVSADRIPRTALGKPRRAALQKQLLENEFKPLSGADHRIARDNRSLPAWFFSQVWVPRSRLPATREFLRNWVVLSGEPEHADEIAAVLKRHGCSARPTSAEHVDVGDGEALLILPQGSARTARLSDVDFLKALRALQAGAQPSAVVVLSHASMGNDARLTGAEACVTGAMFGLWQALSREHAGQRLRWIDVPTDWSDERRISAVLEEAQGGDDAVVIRLREGSRTIPRFEPECFADSASTLLQPHRQYLVTGAAGALGTILCRHLMTAWSATVIGVSRRHQPVGQLHMLAADVAQPGALDAALTSRFGGDPRIDGIFHLAGAFRPCSLSDLQEQDYRAEIEAKGAGTLHALETLRQFGSEGAFLVAFGSATAYVGGTGAAAYAAASAAQQFICDAANRSGVPARYLAWSQWPGLGLARENPLAALTSRHGLCDISASRGMRSMERALASSRTSLIVGLDPTNEAVAASVATPAFEPRLILNVVAGLDKDLELPTRGTDRFAQDYRISVELSAATAHAAGAEYERMEKLLIALWSEVLGCAEVDVRRNFFEMGGNSMRLLQAKSRLEAMLERSLDVAVLFRYPTIQQLAMHLSRPTSSTAATGGLRGTERRRARNRRSS